MCGLVGIMGSDDKLNVPFNFLLEVDAVRGKDSTGILAVDKEGHARWLKDTVLPPELMLETDYDKLTGGGWGTVKNKTDPFLLMGHNRAATKGKITVENAHPFQHKHIFLMHNGTIHNQFPLTDKMKKTFATDSENLTSFVSEFGIKDAWKNMTGAAALAYYNQTDNTLNLITNGERPLYFAVEKDSKYVIYASELWMLHGAESRYDLDIDGFYTLRPHNLHTFEFDPEADKVSMVIKVLDKYVAPARIWPKIKPHQGRRHGQYFDTEAAEWKNYTRNRHVSELFPHKIGKKKRKKLEKKADKAVPKIIKKSTGYSDALRMVFETPFKGEPSYNVILRQKIAAYFSDKAKAAEEKDKKVSQAIYGIGGGEPDEYWDTTSAGPDTYPLAIVEMDEAEFHNTFTECFYCRKNLKHEYDEAVVFNHSETGAICGDCATTAAANDMYLGFSI